MKSSETLIDDNGIEVIVGYNYEKDAPYFAEINNPATFVPATVGTELTSVEIVICGVGIDVLPQLNEKQKSFLINKLTYNV